MTRLLPPRLVALTPGDLDAWGVERFLPRAARAVTAGLRGVMLRESELEDGAALALARALAEILAAHDGWLCVHDRAHLVAPANARAVHVGFRSLPARIVRDVVGEEVAIGVSTHAGDDPQTWSGADYVVFGPVFETPSKRGLVDPVGLDGLAARCAESDLPVWAIGGLQPEHAGAVRDAGAAGVAVLGGVFGSEDPAAATRRYLAATTDGDR